MKNIARFNANRKATSQGMTQVLINDVNRGISEGSIEKLRPFTTGDGFLYTNKEKGPLLFVVAQDGTFYSVAKYLVK